jgi:hypothetical protein
MARKTSSTKNASSTRQAGTAKQTTAAPKMGKWQIKRQGENQLVVTLPEGLKIDGDGPLTVEDLLHGISVYMSGKKGPIVACCTRRVMMAIS